MLTLLPAFVLADGATKPELVHDRLAAGPEHPDTGGSR